MTSSLSPKSCSMPRRCCNWAAGLAAVRPLGTCRASSKVRLACLQRVRQPGPGAAAWGEAAGNLQGRGVGLDKLG